MKKGCIGCLGLCLLGLLLLSFASFFVSQGLPVVDPSPRRGASSKPIATRNIDGAVDEKRTAGEADVLVEPRNLTPKNKSAVREIVLSAPEVDLSPASLDWRTWQAKTGKTTEARMVGYENSTSTVTLEKRNGKLVDVPAKLLEVKDRNYIVAHWKTLNAGNLVGVFWWNCPAKNERHWYICRQLVKRTSRDYEVHELSTGHSTSPDSIEVLSYVRRGNQFIAAAEGYSDFRIIGDNEELITEHQDHYYSSPQLAKEKTDATAGANIVGEAGNKADGIKGFDDAFNEFVAAVKAIDPDRVYFVDVSTFERSFVKIRVSNGWLTNYRRREQLQQAQQLETLWHKLLERNRGDSGRMLVFVDLFDNTVAQSSLFGGMKLKAEP